MKKIISIYSILSMVFLLNAAPLNDTMGVLHTVTTAQINTLVSPAVASASLCCEEMPAPDSYVNIKIGDLK